MTDKHTAEHSKAACLTIYWPESDVYMAHTTIKPEVSISLTEMPFLILQVNFHTSNDFCDWRLLKGTPIPKVLTCMKIYLYKQKWQFCQGDLYFWLFCCMNNFCISHRLIYIPTHSF